MINKILTEHELLKRLDNEFDDVDFEIRDCATKGVVATVYFHEKNLSRLSLRLGKTCRNHRNSPRGITHVMMMIIIMMMTMMTMIMIIMMMMMIDDDDDA